MLCLILFVSANRALVPVVGIILVPNSCIAVRGSSYVTADVTSRITSVIKSMCFGCDLVVTTQALLPMDSSIFLVLCGYNRMRRGSYVAANVTNGIAIIVIYVFRFVQFDFANFTNVPVKVVISTPFGFRRVYKRSIVLCRICFGGRVTVAINGGPRGEGF